MDKPEEFNNNMEWDQGRKRSTQYNKQLTWLLVGIIVIGIICMILGI